MTETVSLRLIYCAIITFAFLIARIGRFYQNKQKHAFAYLVMLSLSLLIGSRPVLPLTDLAMYHGWFNQICKGGWSVIANKFDEFGKDPLFSLLLFATAPLKSFQFTLTLISFLSLFLTYKVCKLYTKGEKKGSPLLLFFCAIINFTFLNQQDNVMRIGIAFPLFLLYIYYYFRHEYKEALVFGILAVGVHFSMAVAVIVSIVAKYVNYSLKWYYVLFFAILAASAAGASVQQFAGKFGFGKAEFYSQLTEAGKYITGFRPDFALFNTIFLLFFIWLNKKRPTQFLTYYIRLYVLFSCWFFLWFKVPFNDRVGAFSWNLIPFISYFGCIDKFPKNKVTWGSWLFGILLLMNLVIFIHIFSLF